MMIFALFVLASFLIVIAWVCVGLYQRLDVLMIDYQSRGEVLASVQNVRDELRHRCSQLECAAVAARISGRAAAEAWDVERESIMYDRDCLRERAEVAAADRDHADMHREIANRRSWDLLRLNQGLVAAATAERERIMYDRDMLRDQVERYDLR